MRESDWPTSRRQASTQVRKIGRSWQESVSKSLELASLALFPTINALLLGKKHEYLKLF